MNEIKTKSNNTNGYYISHVTSVHMFTTMKIAWDAFAPNNRNLLPFYCYDWFRIWLEHFATNRELMIVNVEKQNKLLAIAPLIAIKEYYRKVRIRKLELIGNVYSPVRSILTDVSDILESRRALERLFSHLCTSNKIWDMLDLSTIPEESGQIEEIKQVLSGLSIAYKEYHCFGDWYQDSIDCSGDEYVSRLPEKMVKDIQYCKRRLEREGRLEIRVINSKEHLNDHLDVYYNVYAKSWQQQERIGPTFHRDLAEMAAEKGWLRLGFLFHDDIPRAAQFWLVANGTAFILKTVYDQEFKKYSPGKVLTSEMFKRAIDVDKVTIIDYVQGDEDYKKDWTPKRRERKGLLVYNGSIKGRYLSLVDRKIAPFINNRGYLKKLKQVLSNSGLGQ